MMVMAMVMVMVMVMVITVMVVMICHQSCECVMAMAHAKNVSEHGTHISGDTRSRIELCVPRMNYEPFFTSF